MNQKRVALSLTAVAIVLVLLLFAADRIAGYPLDATSSVHILFAVAGVLSWGLLRFERYRLVAWLMVGMLFFSAAASAYFTGSARTVSLVLIAAGQVVAGIYLTRRALVWVTLAAVSLLAGMSWADTAGLLMDPPSLAVGLRTWSVQAVGVIVAAMVVQASREQMRVAQELLMRESGQRSQIRSDRDEGLDRFRLVFDSSPTPIFVQSARTGVILDANPAFESVTGYLRSEVLQRRDSFLWLAGAQQAAYAARRRAQMHTDWMPVTCVRKDGRHLDLLVCSEQDERPEEDLVMSVMRLHPSGDNRHRDGHGHLPHSSAANAAFLPTQVGSIDV